MDSRYIDILIGTEEKKSKFQHYASIFSFVKNTKLQLYESIMQNLNENYFVIKSIRHAHTNTLYVPDKKICWRFRVQLKNSMQNLSPCRSRQPKYWKNSVLIFEIMKASTIVTNCFILFSRAPRSTSGITWNITFQYRGYILRVLHCLRWTILQQKLTTSRNNNCQK